MFDKDHPLYRRFRQAGYALNRHRDTLIMGTLGALMLGEYVYTGQLNPHYLGAASAVEFLRGVY